MGRNPAELRVQVDEKNLKLLSLSQPDRDQSGGIDGQARALRDDRCVKFGGANHTFDSFATEKKRLEGEFANYGLGEL
jgi:hypothetical protein